jgi:leucyl/phenylalanyl-tRNA---protein transferase
MVLYPHEIHVSRRLNRLIRQGKFSITADGSFPRVIRECAAVRGPGRPGTWIVDEMRDAYCRLHDAGFAHSVEVWKQGQLAGGLYGVSLGRCFLGESMFTRDDNASKVALVHLARQLQQWGFAFIDCQVITGHMKRLGARTITRTRFLNELQGALRAPTRRGPWRFDAVPED